MFGSRMYKAKTDGFAARAEALAKQEQESTERLDAAGYDPFTMDAASRSGVCRRCGSVVADTDVHDAWHNDVLSGSGLHDAIHYGG